MNIYLLQLGTNEDTILEYRKIVNKEEELVYDIMKDIGFFRYYDKLVYIDLDYKGVSHWTGLIKQLIIKIRDDKLNEII